MELVIWDSRYITGIELIDNQHKQLVDLTNNLYTACLGGNEELPDLFRDAMHHMVEYVQHHFNTELELLKQINYPDYHNHKVMHNTLVNDIISSANDFKEGKHFVPNHFVRTLKDWIFGHIAVNDKDYALFVKDQIRTGLLTEQKLHDIGQAISGK